MPFPLPVGPFLRIPVGGGGLDPCLKNNIKQPTDGGAVYGAGIQVAYTAETLVGAAGTPVSSWADNSGGGHPATNANVPTQPLVDIVNGVRVLLLDTALKTLSIAGLSVASSDLTLYAAYRGDLTGQGFKTQWSSQSVNGGFAIEPDTSLVTAHDEEFNASASDTTTPGTCKWHVATFVIRSGTNVIEIWRKGVLLSSVGVVVSAQTRTSWVIGDTGGGFGWIGRIVELRAYNVAQSAATILNEATTIHNRWGFP